MQPATDAVMSTRRRGPMSAARLAALRLGLHPGRDVVLRHRRALPRRVLGRHRAQGLVALLVVLIALEDDHDGRLLGVGVVEDDDLGRRHSLRRLTLFDLLAHLVHPVLADPFEGHNTCERHASLPPWSISEGILFRLVLAAAAVIGPYPRKERKMAQITQLGPVLVPVSDQDAAIEWYTTNL